MVGARSLIKNRIIIAIKEEEEGSRYYSCTVLMDSTSAAGQTTTRTGIKTGTVDDTEENG